MKICFDKIEGFSCRMFCLGMNDDIEKDGIVAVKDFLRGVIEQQRVKGIVFTYDYCQKAFVVKALIDSIDVNNFLGYLSSGMIKYRMCLLMLKPDTDIDPLLKYYESNGEEEALSGKRYEDAIGGEIHLPFDFLDEKALFLLVHHDGSPVFFIKASSR